MHVRNSIFLIIFEVSWTLWRTSGSALISPLGYLNLHFHNQTAGLSMSYMNISKNKANRLNYELFICLSYSQTSQAPQSFHMVTLRPQFDGSRLNTNSIENFYIIIISCNSPFNIRHIITWALITYPNICANKPKVYLFCMETYEYMTQKI